MVSSLAFGNIRFAPVGIRRRLSTCRGSIRWRGTACTEESVMAKKSEEGVYRIVDVVGVSETSWEDAGRQAVKTASKSLRDLRIAEVTKMDMKVENGKVMAFRTRVAPSFKYEGLLQRRSSGFVRG